jgi:hypothetical protein
MRAAAIDSKEFNKYFCPVNRAVSILARLFSPDGDIVSDIAISGCAKPLVLDHDVERHG